MPTRRGSARHRALDPDRLEVGPAHREVQVDEDGVDLLEIGPSAGEVPEGVQGLVVPRCRDERLGLREAALQGVDGGIGRGLHGVSSGHRARPLSRAAIASAMTFHFSFVPDALRGPLAPLPGLAGVVPDLEHRAEELAGVGPKDPAFRLVGSLGRERNPFRGNEPAGPLVVEVRRGAALGGDDGQPAGARFRDRHREALGPVGVDEDVAGPVERGHLPVVELLVEGAEARAGPSGGPGRGAAACLEHSR
jgi:hypothetical protein